MIFTLIGMPGAGKSCFGRAIAPRLGYQWLDGDRLIEQRTGRKLQDIINQDGLAEFKRLEEQILLSVTEDRTVLSTGGSAVYYDSVMRHFSALGKIIYLRVGLPTLVHRLGDFSKRGIALRPGQTIADLYRERTALYEKYADITVDCDGDDYEAYHETVLHAMKQALEQEQ